MYKNIFFLGAESFFGGETDKFMGPNSRDFYSNASWDLLLSAFIV